MGRCVDSQAVSEVSVCQPCRLGSDACEAAMLTADGKSTKSSLADGRGTSTGAGCGPDHILM